MAECSQSPPNPHRPATTYLLSVSLDLPVLHSQCTGIVHYLVVLVWLFKNQHNVLEVNPLCVFFIHVVILGGLFETPDLSCIWRRY